MSKCTIITTIENKVEIYGKVVLVVFKKHTDINGKISSSTEFSMLRKSFYDKMCRQNNDWLDEVELDIPGCERLSLITQKYLKHYQTQAYWVYEGARVSIETLQGIRKILRSGDHTRIVMDATGYNGLLYDLDGKPVLRTIHVDYIQGCVQEGNEGSDNYDVSRAAAYLQTHPKVRDVQIIGIPYYNGGGRAVEFSYIPDSKEFQKMASSGYRGQKRGEDDPVGGIGDFKHFEHIKKTLKVDQFKR